MRRRKTRGPGVGGGPAPLAEQRPHEGADRDGRRWGPRPEHGTRPPKGTHLEPAEPDHAVHHLGHAEAVPEVVEGVVPVVVLHAELRETEAPMPMATALTTQLPRVDPPVRGPAGGWRFGGALPEPSSVPGLAGGRGEEAPGEPPCSQGPGRRAFPRAPGHEEPRGDGIPRARLGAVGRLWGPALLTPVPILVFSI